MNLSRRNAGDLVSKTALLGCLIFLSTCQSNSQDKELEILAKDFKKGLEQATEKINQLAPSQQQLKQSTVGEVEKLFSLEYRVIDIDRDVPAAEIEARLAALGRDRWDCFHIEPTAGSLRLFCKRRPQSYLRYIPVPSLW